MEDNTYKWIEYEANWQVRKAIDKFGLEGTLEKIEDLYSEMPTIKKLMIKIFYKILSGEK